MTEPAFRNREDMSEHLKAAGFDDQQIRSILQVVAGLMKEMGLAIRADLAKSEQRSDERHERAQKLSDERHERAQKLSDERHERAQKLSDERHQINLELHKQAFLWIRWGFGMIGSFLLALLGILITGVIRGWL